jgi:hypothetical protein
MFAFISKRHVTYGENRRPEPSASAQGILDFYTSFDNNSIDISVLRSWLLRAQK